MLIEDFKAQRFRYLVNVAVLTTNRWVMRMIVSWWKNSPLKSGISLLSHNHNQNTHSCVDNIQAENKMARAVHRSGLVALGIATALMASCAFAAKDVVVAVGSNFTTLDPYDANDTLSQAVAKSFYQGLFGLDKETTLTSIARVAMSGTASTLAVPEVTICGPVILIV